MSDSAESITGEGAEPPRDVRQDIDAEIADHLAMSAQASARAGAAGEDAVRAATAKFGSVNRVRFQCWWVKQGDLVMRKAAIYGGLVLVVGLLVAGVALPTIASLRSVRDNVEQLTTQLAALTKAQQDLIEKQSAAQAPVELKGKCYLKTEDTPAVGADVEIWNADEMKLVRHVRTDEIGEFISGPLAVGTYFALAPLASDLNTGVTWRAGASASGYGPRYAVQTAPVHLYSAAKNDPVALDLYFPVVDIGFRLSNCLNGTGTIPTSNMKYAAEIMVTCGAIDEATLPHNLIQSAAPSAWPLVGARRLLASPIEIQPTDLAQEGPLWLSGRMRSDAQANNVPCAGKYRIGAMLYAVNVGKNNLENALLNGRQQRVPLVIDESMEDRQIVVDVPEGKQAIVELVLPSQDEFEQRLVQQAEKSRDLLAFGALKVIDRSFLEIKAVAIENLDSGRLTKAVGK